MSGWEVRADGIVLTLRVSPRASREGIGPGRDAHEFALRTTAPPVDGEANAAVVRIVAKAFGVPRRDVAIRSGDAARAKRVHVAGDPIALARIAASLYGAGHEC